MRDRLYEHNYDPEPLDSKNGMRVAISKFQQKSSMTPTGEATEGVLIRLRKIDELTPPKPWATIVYDEESDKWGMSWQHETRRAAVEDALKNCGTKNCTHELSFYGKRCGAFAHAKTSWALEQSDSVAKAKEAALKSCSKNSKSCRVIGAVCTDGSGRG